MRIQIAEKQNKIEVKIYEIVKFDLNEFRSLFCLFKRKKKIDIFHMTM